MEKLKNSKKEDIIRENKLKKTAKKRFRARREKQMLDNQTISKPKGHPEKNTEKPSHCEKRNGTNTKRQG